MYARGGYRVDSCSGLRCKEYYACIAWMSSERDMFIGRVRVHFSGLSGDSETFVE